MAGSLGKGWLVGPSVEEGWGYASWSMLNCVVEVEYVHFLRKMVEKQCVSAETEIHTRASEGVGCSWKGAP